MSKVLSYDAKWNVGPQSKGPARVEGIVIPVGLATRHYCSLHGIAPRGKIVKAAVQIAGERGNRMIWLEDLLAAAATVSDDETTLDEVRETAVATRRAQARERRTIRKTEAQAAADAKRAARKAAADARKAAKEATETA